jgi:hypothetical protein
MVEHSAVPSGALDPPLRYFGDRMVYGALESEVASARGRAISVAEAACGIANAVEADEMPLRRVSARHFGHPSARRQDEAPGATIRKRNQ